jgi:transcriptional regulator with XRE-family HTH domain
MRKIAITKKPAATPTDKSPLYVAFGSAVKSMRKNLAITQEELAGRAGLHRTYVTRVETGDCNLSLKCINRLADALGSSMSELLGVAESWKARQVDPVQQTPHPPSAPTKTHAPRTIR